MYIMREREREAVKNLQESGTVYFGANLRHIGLTYCLHLQGRKI
jgi:hypothetical protein